jgi:hypothetical protein
LAHELQFLLAQRKSLRQFADLVRALGLLVTAAQ